MSDLNAITEKIEEINKAVVAERKNNDEIQAKLEK